VSEGPADRSAGVLEAGGDPDLAEKALVTEDGGELGTQVRITNNTAVEYAPAWAH
jgi:hypothetical protein